MDIDKILDKKTNQFERFDDGGIIMILEFLIFKFGQT